MAKPNTQPVIVHLSTYPPRVCGIASFTFDLVSALDRLFNPALSSRVLAMAGPGDRLIPGRKKILGYLKRDDPRGYARAAARLNRKPEVKLISIQHEFGIFGGPRGRHLLLFLRALSKPAIITFHTVLPEPDRSLRQLVRQIASRVQKIVVMTAPSRDILVRDYGLRPGKIKIIPHGIHAFDYALPDRYKQRLGFNPKTIIFSTFGLLSRGKGTEYVLRSLPAIIKKYPRLIYLVLGPTHPEIIRQEGESYRRFLEKLVRELKLQRHVRFRNAYLPLPKLLDYLQATDIYISASLEPRQAVSGTLCYALGAGRPVIATPSAQAQSLITPETGRLAGFRDAETITKAALELLASQNQLRQMGQNAYFRTRHMTWENVALSYARLFSAVVPELALYNVHLPPIKLNHLAALTGPNGIFQFARLSVPDRSSGLTLDDNARALIAAMRYYQTSRDRTALRLSKVYLRFMDRALSRSGRFRNYFDEHMSPNAQMENKDNQEDADARALRVLMELSAAQAAPAALRRRAGNILARRFKSGVHFAHPRAMALYIIGLSYGIPGLDRRKEINSYCQKLTALLRKNSAPGWRWFDKKLTYSNSTLSEALLAGFRTTGRRTYLTAAKQSLDFLISQTFLQGMYMPIGQNGWYVRRGRRAYFDQQPEDVAAMVGTLAQMRHLTGQAKYGRLMQQAFLWFLGDNPLGQLVYNISSGGCYDGLGEKSINLNQGAESTISYLLARLTMENNIQQPGQNKKRV